MSAVLPSHGVAKYTAKRNHTSGFTGLSYQTQTPLQSHSQSALCKAARVVYGRRQGPCSGAKRTAVAVAAAAGAQSTAAVKATIRIDSWHLAYGDTVRAVGDAQQLGAWDASNAPQLDWQEGDNWVLTTELPPGDMKFKLVLVHGDGSKHWEGGDDRSVQVPADAGNVTVSCVFNDTGFTSLMVTPDSLAPQQEEAAAKLIAQAEQPQNQKQEQKQGEQQPGQQAASPPPAAAASAGGPPPPPAVLKPPAKVTRDEDELDGFEEGDSAPQVEAVQAHAQILRSRKQKLLDDLAQLESDGQAPSEAVKAPAQKAQQVLEQKVPGEISADNLKDTVSGLREAERHIEQGEQAKLEESGVTASVSASEAADIVASLDEQKSSDNGSSPASSQTSAPQASNSAQPPAQAQGENGDRKSQADSFPTFGHSRVADVSSDGTVTITFEEDSDDEDAATLAKKILSRGNK